MPWFYFHLRGPKGLDRDDVGLELAGIEAAYLEACRSIPGMSADLVYREENPTRYRFEITDGGGALLMEVPFTEVLERGRKPVAPSSAARFRKGRVEMQRTAQLIREIEEKQAGLQATLAETKRVLGLLRAPGRIQPEWRVGVPPDGYQASDFDH